MERHAKKKEARCNYIVKQEIKNFIRVFLVHQVITMKNTHVGTLYLFMTAARSTESQVKKFYY